MQTGQIPSSGVTVTPQHGMEPRWAFVCGLCLLSGAAALGHQLLWTRRLIDLLGASAESSARVFGVFFLGLALGSVLAFWLVKRAKRPWRWLLIAELGILALAIPVYSLPVWSAWIWPALGPERLIEGWGATLKLALSVALILPPAVMMGWFLPFLAVAVLGKTRSLEEHGLSAYGWNTLGGVLGLGLTAGLFLPLVGAVGAAGAVMAMNLLTAAGCLWLDARTKMSGVTETIAKQTSGAAGISRTPADNRGIAPTLYGLAFFSGFGVLALEVVSLQMLMLVAPLSFYAPAGILFCVILVLALAAFGAAKLRQAAKVETLIPISLLAAGILAASLPAIFYYLAATSGGLPPAALFSLFLIRLFAFVLLVCGPAFLAAGLLFPLLTAWSAERGRDHRGWNWGRILAVNGLGGLCGAEAAYRLLLPNFGPYASAWAIGAMYCLVGAAATVWFVKGEKRGPSAPASLFAPSAKKAAISAAAALAIIATLWRPVSSLPLVNPHLRFTILAEKSGRDGVLSVVERGDLGRGLLMYNQYMLGSTAVRHDQARQAHLPLLLHGSPDRVAFIGLATGITPGAALQHYATGEVTAIELSQTVAAAARDYFGQFNYGLFDDPRANVVIEDGRTFIAAARGRFDVVVGDLFLPWGPGEARLYSLEHFKAVRDSLDDGGIFCQWLALYQLRPEDLEIILRTFSRAFPDGHMFVNTFQPDMPTLALVGFRNSALDWETARRRTDAERLNGGIRDPSVRHLSGLQLLHLGPIPSLQTGPINTLNNLLIELAAGRERVSGDPSRKYLQGRRWLEWTEEMRSRPELAAVTPPELVEAARLLTRQEVLLREGKELEPLDRRRLPRLLYYSMPPDFEADWSQWPGAPLHR